MIPATANENEPDDRLTGAGLVFVAIAIVIGMGAARSDVYSLVAGVAMLVLIATVYFVGSARADVAIPTRAYKQPEIRNYKKW